MSVTPTDVVFFMEIFIEHGSHKIRGELTIVQLAMCEFSDFIQLWEYKSKLFGMHFLYLYFLSKQRGEEFLLNICFPFTKI